MVRNILAIVLALVLGGACVLAIEVLGHKLYPIPESFDMSDMQQVAEYVRTAPAGALAFVLLAQSAGSFVGGLTASVVAKAKKMRMAGIYGIIALVLAMVNVLAIPHPVWMVALALLLPIPVALVGGLLGSIASSAGPSSLAAGEAH